VNIGHSKSFKELAVAAAAAAGFPPPEGGQLEDKAAAVAADNKAVAARDAAWAKYEDILRDDRTYTLQQIQDWLRDAWKIDLGISSIQRDRLRVLEGERRNELANKRIKQAFDLAAELPGQDLFHSGQKLIGQMILNNLLNYSADDLDDLKPSHIIAMMDIFNSAAKKFAETGLIQARVKQITALQDELDRRKAVADRQASEVLGDRGVDAATIQRIRDIYGLPRLDSLGAPVLAPGEAAA